MNNKKFLLPYGDALRDFLNQPSITKSELKSILKRRGVFFSDDDKQNTIPLIIKTGVSPSELEELRDKIKLREDNPKILTQSVPWDGGDKTLLESVHNDISIQDIVQQPFSNYKIIGAPNFTHIDGDQNHVEMDFRIERYDLTKSWDKNTAQFGGKITLKKGSDNVNINMRLTHTSPETKYIAQKVTRKIVKDFKDDGYVKTSSSIRKIRFNDFVNENRLMFFQDLSQNQLSQALYFKDTRDIGFRPDESKTLPEDLSWMEDKINNLILQGEKIHTTFFVKEKKYHEFLEVYRIEADYSFEYDEYSGECSISFQFADFISKNKNDAELVINVERLSFIDKNISISSSKVKELLLSQLEESKLSLHRQYAKKELGS